MSAVRRWARELTLGARFAIGGGAEGWVRTLLTAVGVGLGVMLLLFAAAVPAMLDSHSMRSYGRQEPFSDGTELKPTAGTLLVKVADTTFRDVKIRGRLMRPEGPKAPVPPGLDRLPGPGEMAVSPALARMLRDPGDRLLRERLPYRVTATIGPAGLDGPADLTYIAGNASVQTGIGHAQRIDHFGIEYHPQKLDPILVMLVVIALVVLLVPVAVFIGTAVRFGGERRDRRLAALRLVGADTAMARRIAAGEALLGSLLGLVLGGAFFLAVRRFVGSVTLWDFSVYPSDVTPEAALTALIALAVPAAAVAVTVVALRGVAIEPLGVVRRSVPRPRRLWWRLLPPAAGLLLLWWPIGRSASGGTADRYRIAVGAVLLLIGVTTLLPWLVEAVVRRLRGGPVAWQLATRRLQLTSGAAARTVGGITVAVAGAIAVQTLFSGVEPQYTGATGQDPSQAQVMADIGVRDGVQARQIFTAFRTTQGVQWVLGTTQSQAAAVGAVAKARASGKPDAVYDIPQVPITAGDCATLRLVASIGTCRDGDVFLVPSGTARIDAVARPGHPVDLNLSDAPPVTGRPRLWTVPATARTVPRRTDATGVAHEGILVTPGALPAGELASPRARVLVRLDPHDPDAVERVRNTASRMDPSDPTFTLHATRKDSRFAAIERGLLIGATATLLVLGASMLISMLEQLRERRRLLAVLSAFGTRWRTLGMSVLWQAAVPVVLGLALALAGGLGLGALLLKMAHLAVAYDWASVAAMTAVGGAVVLLVTVVSLPPLWRMTRPDGLRTE